MSDHLALTVIRTNRSEALSARPGAPVVDDGRGAARAPQAPAAVRPVRRSLAATLRAAASAERRWADRLDPACG